MSNEERIHQLRKQLPLVKETLLETITREREYEMLYREASRERSIIQAYYTTLEIQLADLEDRIQRLNATTTKTNKPAKNKELSIEEEKDLMERMLASLDPDQLQAVLAQLNIK